MVTNTFCFNVKSRFVRFFPDVFGHLGKQLDKKAKVYFKCYDVINWETNYNTYIGQYLKE